ncbi:MAG: ANTAR domain-containing protein [Mycobacterium sp.]|nr:ANTAR domain-containing protein [Mycobacterium sp.]
MGESTQLGASSRREIDADRAFEILKWRSQATQVKLRTVATRFVESAVREGLTLETVAAIDHLLLADGSADQRG